MRLKKCVLSFLRKLVRDEIRKNLQDTKITMANCAAK